MLAAFGFGIAAICFAVFASTFQKYVVKHAGPGSERLAYAFYTLAYAFMFWCLVVGSGHLSLLPASVLAGEALILLGTWYLLPLVLPGTGWAVYAAVAFLALLVLRAVYLYPSPTLTQGIVIFNIPTLVVVALSVLIIGVWLPACAKVAKKVASALKDPGVERIYASIYVASALSALLFVGTRRPLTAALSFAALVMCLGLLIASNVVVKLAAKPARGGRRA
jgi:hypothetical protein